MSASADYHYEWRETEARAAAAEYVRTHLNCIVRDEDVAGFRYWIPSACASIGAELIQLPIGSWIILALGDAPCA